MNWWSLNAKKLFEPAPATPVRSDSGTPETRRSSLRADRHFSTVRPDSREEDRLAHRSGPRPEPSLVSFGPRDPEPRLDPDGQGMPAQGFVGNAPGDSSIHGRRNRGKESRLVERRRDPFQRLEDDIALRDLGREELRRGARDDAPLLLERTFARERRRGAYALETLRREPFPHAPDEERDVGALTPSIGV
jgi:hypothetical protein